MSFPVQEVLQSEKALNIGNYGYIITVFPRQYLFVTDRGLDSKLDSFWFVLVCMFLCVIIFTMACVSGRFQPSQRSGFTRLTRVKQEFMPGSWMGSHFCTQCFLGKDAFLTEMSGLHYGIEFSKSQSKTAQISRLST